MRLRLSDHHSRRAFTLIEMLTTVAVLIIVLGLMVSLARNVRDRSAQQLTRELLLKMAQLVAAYAEQNGRQLPVVTPIIPADAFLQPEEPAIRLLAQKNNKEFVQALRQEVARAELSASGDAIFGQLPLSVYDGTTLRDAWGSPIVFMPSQHRWIGMAPKAREGEAYFFFSAGPDGQYLSRDDNLYSYEVIVGETP